jgi:hypothetical protein
MNRPIIKLANTAVLIAPSFPLAANRVAQKGNNPFRSVKSPIKYPMNDQAPNSPGELGLVINSVKIMPVRTLSIWAANMMKPEYLTLISLLDSRFTFSLVVVVTFGL